MPALQVQNPKKVKRERIETLFKKACLLSRIFLHNPPQTGRIALLVEHDAQWQVFLSDERGQWPIDFDVMHPLKVRYVKDLRTETEAQQDLEVERVGVAVPHNTPSVPQNDRDDEEDEGPSFAVHSQPLGAAQEHQPTPDTSRQQQLSMSPAEETLPDWNTDAEAPQRIPTTPTVPTSANGEGHISTYQSPDSMGQRSSRARMMLNRSPTEFRFRGSTRRPLRRSTRAQQIN